MERHSISTVRYFVRDCIHMAFPIDPSVKESACKQEWHHQCRSPSAMQESICNARVQFSHSVVSDFLRPQAPEHGRPTRPSITLGVHPNPCQLSWWCYPTISSSVVPFSFCPQCFLASRSFQMSQLFTSGGQNIGVQLQQQSFQGTPRTDLL